MSITIRIRSAIDARTRTEVTRGTTRLAMRISHASDAHLSGKIAGGGGARAVRVGFADQVRGRGRRGKGAGPVGGAESVSSLGSSPLLDGAIGLGSAFDAATAFEMAFRGARVGAVSVLGAKIDADSGEGVAVRVTFGGGGRTILSVGASGSGGILSAISAKTIGIAITARLSRTAIGVTSAVDANSVHGVALGLLGFETAVVHAIGILGTGQARAIFHAVVTAAESFATIIVGRSSESSVARVGRSATARFANSVGTHGRGAVVGHAVGVVGAGAATSVLHAIFGGKTFIVVVASVDAQARVGSGILANGLVLFFTTIAHPCRAGFASGAGAVVVGSASVANAVLHAILTLSACASSVDGASVDTLTRGLLAVRLVGVFSCVRGGASGGSVVDDAREARARSLTISAAGSCLVGTGEGSGFGVGAVLVFNASEGIHADSGSVARGLSGFSRKSRDGGRRAVDGAALCGVKDDRGAARGLAVCADSVDTAVSTVVGGYSGLCGLLSRAVGVGSAGALTNVGLRVADGLAVGVSAEVARSAGDSTFTAVIGTANGSARSTLETLAVNLTVGA